MADYGVSATDYAPDVNVYSGLIGKIAKQVIEGETVRTKFDSLFKDPIEYGKDLETVLYEAATGVAYSPTDPTVTAGEPKSHVLYFKDWTKRSYGVLLDQNQIDEGSIDGAAATRIAQTIVDTLYQGDRREKNGYIMSALAGTSKGAPGTAAKNIVDGGTYAVPSDKETAQTVLLAIQNYADKVRDGSPAVNMSKLEVPANRVVLILPQALNRQIGTYLLAQTYDNDYSRYGVNEIITYDPTIYTEANEAIFIFDDRYTQFRQKPTSYKEKPMPESDNVKSFLHSYRMYAICDLFPAVRIDKTV